MGQAANMHVVELLMRTDGRQIEGKSSCKAIAVPPRRGQRPHTSMAGLQQLGARVNNKDVQGEFSTGYRTADVEAGKRG